MVAALAFPACGSQQPKEGEDLGLVRVLSVSQGVVGPYNQGQCQVDVDVEAMLPHCGAWGDFPLKSVDGNTFHYEAHAAYSGFACANGPGWYETGVGMCMPGAGQLTQPPPLPAGTYYVEVNGVTGSFTIP
jgi:hypothetical protein